MLILLFEKVKFKSFSKLVFSYLFIKRVLQKCMLILFYSNHRLSIKDGLENDYFLRNIKTTSYNFVKQRPCWNITISEYLTNEMFRKK